MTRRGQPALNQARKQSTKTLAEIPKNDSELRIKISEETIKKLEKLSLVNFGNETGITRLESAVRFAERLRSFAVHESVEPLYSVLENQKLKLRSDAVTEGDCREKILRNAALLEEEYFVTPLGSAKGKK